ncbi:MAG: hypothetical protein ABR579_10640 [Actinomycetota bacterium]
MKSALKWLLLTLGLGSLWLVTRVVAFYFFGVLTFFATAFQATINEMTKITGVEPEPRKREQLPSRLAHARGYAEKNTLVVDVEPPATIDLRDGVSVG